MLTHGLEYNNEKDKDKKIEKQVMECEFCDRKFKYKKSFLHHLVEEHGMFDEDNSVNVLQISCKENKDEENKKSCDASENIEGSSVGKAQETSLNTQTNTKYTTESNNKDTDEEDFIKDNNENETNSLEKDKNPKKNYTCHVCEAKFPRANHLTRHMTLHRSLLIFKCDRCDKSYSTEEHLQKHLQEDHIDKPYSCSVCQKSFSRGEHLIRHLRIHDDPDSQGENLKCSICEKFFSR